MKSPIPYSISDWWNFMTDPTQGSLEQWLLDPVYAVHSAATPAVAGSKERNVVEMADTVD